MVTPGIDCLIHCKRDGPQIIGEVRNPKIFSSNHTWLCQCVYTGRMRESSQKVLPSSNVLNPSCTKVFGTHTFYERGGGGG